jgi:two-component system, OmpR family, sensor histidine kinase ChvG
VLVQSVIDARASRDGHVETRFCYDRADDAVIVLGDELRIARVVDNLIDNALSFAPSGSSIRLSVGVHDGKGIFAVEDDGPGVAAGAREAIFRRFHSDRPESDPFGRHSGLGLAIAKTIVDGHNGVIAVTDSESGSGGARFTVKIPLVGG